MIEKWLKNENSIKSWRRFRRNKAAVFSSVFLVLILILSLTAEMWANRKPIVMRYHGQTYFPVFKYYHPSLFGQEDVSQTDYRHMQMREDDWAVWPLIHWDPYERNDKVEEFPSPPSASNIMGTDVGGRDVAARLLYGFRYSIGYALGVWLLSSLVGALLGAVMGFAGGWTDLLGQRVIEVIQALPFLMILITLVSIFEPSIFLLIVLTVFFGWVGISIYFRAEFLSLRKRDFVQAALASGASKWRIIVKHILPNSLTPWITISPFIVAGNISGLAALDFLGFGLQAPTPSWGELLNQALDNFRTAWWLAVYPSAALFVTLTVLNLIGDGVRDAIDPRG